MAELTFHSMADSAYLWTAMHVADEKSVSYEFVPLTYRSPEHLKLHPFGKMPVLQHRDAFLYETLAITHYIDAAFDGPALRPASPLGQAHMLRWISIINAYVFPTMNRFTKERLVRPAWGFEPDQAFIESAKEPLTLQIRLIDEAVAQTKYLVGDDLTIADSFLLPHLLFFGRTPEGAALLSKARNANSWLARMSARPSYTRNPMSSAFSAFRQLAASTPSVW
jgi:glutathione S-transferase